MNKKKNRYKKIPIHDICVACNETLAEFTFNEVLRAESKVQIIKKYIHV